MRLAAKGWPKRGTNSLEVGDRYGAAVAHTEVVKAALEFNVIDAVHVLVDDLQSPGFHLHPAESNALADDLVQQFGRERVKLTSLLDANSCFQDRNCVILSGGSELVYHAIARPYLASSSFPICAILHAVKWDILFATYAYTKVFCEPFDVLVTTSTAGKSAVDAILNKAGTLMCCSHCDATERNKFLHLEHIPLAVNERCFFASDQMQARQEFGIPPTSTVLLYLGRLSENFKADLEPLVVTTSKLIRENPEILLVLSGQDTQEIYTNVLSEIASLIGVGSNLKIIPNLPPRLKPLLYSAADIFVSPVDNIQETFGLTLLEAMATQLPVVASDWSGYRDIVRDGREGFLIPTYWSRSSADKLLEWPQIDEFDGHGIEVPGNDQRHSFADAPLAPAGAGATQDERAMRL